MNKTRTCPMCDGKTKAVFQEYASGESDAKTGEEIIVKDVAVHACQDPECEHTWLPSDEEKRIDKEVASRSRFDLGRDEIRLIRESLPFKTKYEVAKFLSLNEKAFTKWELGRTEPNRAYDLLLRLSVFSRENLKFIERLHKKSFRFDPGDYELIRDAKPLEGKSFMVSEQRYVLVESKVKHGVPKAPSLPQEKQNHDDWQPSSRSYEWHKAEEKTKRHEPK